MPQVGDGIEESGYRFTIDNLEGSRVGQVTIERILAVDAEKDVPDSGAEQEQESEDEGSKLS